MADRGLVRFQVFSLWAPTKEALESPEMRAFEGQVNEILADPETMEMAMTALTGNARVFADPDNPDKRLFVLDGGKVYRPEDWDRKV